MTNPTAAVSRTLGRSGPTVSALGLGCNNFGMTIDAERTAAVVGAALDAGITHFDTAEMYGEGRSEEFLGAALAGRRDEAFIATKFLPRPADSTFAPGDLAARITASVEQSLTRLGTDRIDLYYQHYADTEAGPDELLSTFERLVADGKVLSVALSNLEPDYLAAVAEGARSAGIPLHAVQIEWNVLNRAVEESLVPAAHAQGLGVVPYFPLASGLLTGKYAGGARPEGSRFAAIPYFAQVATEENLAAVERLTALAADHGRSIVELALGWLLSQPDVSSVIAGATSPEQIATNAASAGWSLGPAELAVVEEALRGR